MLETLDPSSADSWIARGRAPDVAETLASIWREHPDPPAAAPPEERMARIRARANAMRPLNDAIAARSERERQARNFAFLEGKAVTGAISDKDLAILRGRDAHRYDWDAAVRYADGWYAAHSGWAYREPHDGLRDLEQRRAAYAQGFRDGGGDQNDLFDEARRSFLAAVRTSNQPASAPPAVVGRPLPSSWPKPSDAPAPARWSRKLLIVTPDELAWCLPMLEVAAPRGLQLLLIKPEGKFERIGVEGEAVGEDLDDMDALRAHLERCDLVDVFTTAQGAYLSALDRAAAVLPLARNQERSRNSALQQRAHLRIWLKRGRGAEENRGAGHIRWGKVVQGLTGKLGEFTASYAGPAAPQGHVIAIDLPDGSPAEGFVAADGKALEARIRIGSKARLRQEMETALRTFGGATRLSMAAPLGRAA